MPFSAETADYKKAAAALRGADKKIKKRVTDAAKAAAKPLGRFVAVSAGSRLPQRGGLGFRVAGSTVRVSATPLRVTLGLRTREGYDLKGMNQGTVRHQVFGHSDVWVAQAVQSDLFTEPFDEGAPIVAREVVNAMQDVLNEIAGET